MFLKFIGQSVDLIRALIIYTSQNLWILIGRYIYSIDTLIEVISIWHHCMYFQQEKGYALKKSLAELAIAANKIALKKRTQEIDDER